jgi:hypothetical protein
MRRAADSACYAFRLLSRRECSARSLLQDPGLDLFIAMALNTAPNVAGAFASGGVLGILAVGITAALVPPIVAYAITAVLVLVAGCLALFL